MFFFFNPKQPLFILSGGALSSAEVEGPSGSPQSAVLRRVSPTTSCSLAQDEQGFFY